MDVVDTIVQLTEICKSIKERIDAVGENPEALEKVMTAYTEIEDTVKNLKPHGVVNQVYAEILERELRSIGNTAKKTLATLESVDKAMESTLNEVINAKEYEAQFESLSEEAYKLKTTALNITSLLATATILRDQNFATARASASTPSSFFPCNLIPANPPTVDIDLDARDDRGQPRTFEAQLKAALLNDNKDCTIGEIAHGAGGVGKTTALKALRDDDDIKGRFGGGLYFMSMGQDASIETLIQGLSSWVEASGGINEAVLIREDRNVDPAVRKANAWFQGHPCLFIFDDLWRRNGIRSNLLSSLSVLSTHMGSSNAGSRLVFSTRDEDLVSFGNKISFQRRNKEDSKSMLLKAAGVPDAEADDPVCAEAIAHILERCSGLPVILSMCGAVVGKMRESCADKDKKRSWNTYRSRLNDKMLIYEPPDDSYPALGPSLLVSLSYLDDPKHPSADSNLPMNYTKMHRSLCILKKQDWVRASVLRHLWGLQDEGMALQVMKKMVGVGVADIESRSLGEETVEGLRLHDLVHGFAQHEAQKQKDEGIEYWATTILDAYGDTYTKRGDDWCWPSRLADDDYMVRNIARLLCDCGRYSDLRDLLNSPEWIVRWMHLKQVFQLEQDTEKYLLWLQSNSGSQAEPDLRSYTIPEPSHLIPRSSGKKTCNLFKSLCCFGSSQNEEDEGGSTEYTAHDSVQILCKIARLSMTYCGEDVRCAWFQLYGRLLSTEPKSKWLEEITSSTKRKAPSPWLRPSNAILKGGNNPLLRAHDVRYRIRALKFTQDKNLMSCGEDGDGKVWWTCHGDEGDNEVELESDSLERPKKFGRWCIALNGDEVFVLGIFEKAVVWNCKTGRVFQELFPSVTNVFCGAMSSDGRRAVCGFEDGTVRVWDLVNGRQFGGDLSGHSRCVNCVALSANGSCAVSGSSDKTVRVWNVEKGEEERGSPWSGQSEGVTSIAISANGEFVASGSRTYAFVRRTQNNEVVFEQKDEMMPSCVVVDARSKIWVCGSYAGIAHVYFSMNRERETKYTGIGGMVLAAALSEDCTLLAAGSYQGNIRIWSLKTRERPSLRFSPLTPKPSTVNDVGIREDGKKLVLTFRSIRFSANNVMLLDLKDDGSIGDLDGLRNPSALRLPELLSDDDSVLYIWGVRDYYLRSYALRGHTGEIVCLAVSKNCRRAVTGSRDCTVRLWDLKRKEQIGDPFGDHSDFVSAVAIDGDGTLAVFGSNDGSARLWDLERRRAIGDPLKGHGKITDVAISKDGKRVISRCEDKVFRVWDLNKMKCVQVVEKMYGYWHELRRDFVDEHSVDLASNDDDDRMHYYCTGNKIMLRGQRSEKLLGVMESRINGFDADSSGRRMIVLLDSQTTDQDVAVLSLE